MEIIIEKLVENEDGSADISVSYDEEAYTEAVKWADGKYGDDEQEIMQAFMTHILEEQLDKEVNNIVSDK